jgi:hypothetical protein
LDHPAYLLVTPYDRVEFSLPGKIGQIPTEAKEGLVLVLRVLIGDPLYRPFK